MSTYTITGGSGFIGQHIAKTLTERGHSVRIADIKEPSNPEQKKYWSYCDVTDPYQVTEATTGSSYVIHLAANPQPRLAELNPRWDMRLNIEATLNVIDACRITGARLVFSSTATINYAPTSCYAISKYTAELYIRNAVERKNLDAVIVRFNNIYGPGQPQGYVIPDFIQKLTTNPYRIIITGTGNETRDFVYLEDAAEALLTVLHKGTRGEVYEVGTGRQVTIRELATLIGIILNGQQPEIETTKQGERREYPQNIQPTLSLGWTPRHTLEDGLRKVISHVRASYEGNMTNGGNR